MFGWGTTNAEKTVRRFIAAVNARDIYDLGMVLGERCRFVDSRGCWIEGRGDMLRAAARFFDIEHNFVLTAESFVEHHGEILIQGHCTADDERLALNTLWKARAVEGRLVSWQSFGSGDVPALANILAPDAARDDPLQTVPMAVGITPRRE